MSEPSSSISPALYPEQYELQGQPAGRPVQFRRRAFLQILGTGLVVLCVNRRASAQTETGGESGRPSGQSRPANLDAWLQIATDGTITFFTGKTEMGQNIRTSLTQAVAEELPAPIESIRAVMGDTELTPYDAGTFGSRSTPDMGLQLRRVAATAREALLDLAAALWSVDRGSLTVADGKVLHASSQRSIGFGELTQGRKLVRTISSETTVKLATQWSVAGTVTPPTWCGPACFLAECSGRRPTARRWIRSKPRARQPCPESGWSATVILSGLSHPVPTSLHRRSRP